MARLKGRALFVVARAHDYIFVLVSPRGVSSGCKRSTSRVEEESTAKALSSFFPLSFQTLKRRGGEKKLQSKFHRSRESDIASSDGDPPLAFSKRRRADGGLRGSSNGDQEASCCSGGGSGGSRRNFIVQRRWHRFSGEAAFHLHLHCLSLPCLPRRARPRPASRTAPRGRASPTPKSRARAGATGRPKASGGGPRASRRSRASGRRRL